LRRTRAGARRVAVLGRHPLAPVYAIFDLRGAGSTPIGLPATTTGLSETLIPSAATGSVRRNPIGEGLMADPQGEITGEVQRQPMGDLLRRPPLEPFGLNVGD
jgi:hypothetical protein